MVSIPRDTAPRRPNTVPLRKLAVARPVTLRYLGFECTSQGRSYRLRADRGTDAPRLYTVRIPSDAFEARRVRFQDAAELCLQRLQRELDANAQLPGGASFVITTADLDLHRDAQQRRFPYSKPRSSHQAR